MTAKRVDPEAGALRVTLGLGAALRLPIATDRDHLSLWRAEGQGGQPGIAIVSGLEGPQPGKLLMAAGGDTGALATAYAIAPAGMSMPVLMLWQAGVEQSALPVTVTRLDFADPRKVTAAVGVTDGKLAKHEAVALALPAGPKRLALTVPEEAAIVLVQSGTPQTKVQNRLSST